MIGNIYITGQIGDFEDVKGVNLIDVIGQVKSQPEALSFNVHINSEGGVVEVGFDIYNYLKSLGKPITTIGTGIVASIATIIFMAGDERKINANTQFMIHLPWGSTAGSADDLEQFASELRDAEKQLATFYKKALNLEDEAILPLLKNETWLTVDQLTTLGFINSQPLMAVAKVHFKPKTNKSDMTDNDKSFIEGLFNKVLGKFKGTVLNKKVQDATGAELDFGEVADDATIEVGAKATIDGNPAEGEYLLPDGRTFVFVAGELTEIIEAEEESELDIANARIAELEAERDAAIAARATSDTQLETIRTEVVALKSSIMSRYKVDSKKEKPGKDIGAPTDRSAGAREYLNQKRRK